MDDGGSDASRDDGGTPPVDGGRDGGSDGGSDPCEGLTLCTTEGVSCDGDELVTCAEDANGCLVETIEDCGVAGQLCDESGTVAACIDECDLIPAAMRCDTAGRVCNGDTLEICAANAEGCLVLAATDCTMEEPASECDDTGAMPVCAVPDPCEGITQCGTAETRVCGDTDTITVCAADTNGCFVETTMDCAGGQVCDGTTVTCVDPCSLVDLCPSATYCDGDEVVSCTADVNGCLVEDTRSTCASPSVCRTSGTAASCFDACPEAGARVLSCDSGTVTGNTAVGGTTARAAYACTTFTYAGAEHLYRFETGRTVRQQVTITSNRISSGSDYDLYVLDGGADATCTTATLECLDSSTGTGAAETVDFVGEPGQTEFVAYDVYNAATATTTYNLVVTCRDIICGNGTVEVTEACDDGATADGDGCSSTCQLEPGYSCTGAPSTCTFVCGNGTLNTSAGETCDDANVLASDGCSPTCRVEPGYTCVGTGATSCRTSSANAACTDAIALTTTPRTGDDLRTGGFAPTGTACGSSAGRVLYYSVSVPAGSEVLVAATPTTSFDLTLRSLADCAAGSCLAAVDAVSSGTGASALERIALTNTGAAAATYLVAVGADSTTTMGTFDIVIESTRTLAANATCAGATALTGTLTGQDQATGGPRPTGTSCGSTVGRVLYYSVAIPANSSATVVATPTTSFDLTLRSLAECGTGNCLAAVDAVGSGTGASFAERVTIYNTGAAAATYYVAVGADSSTVFGTFDIAVTTTALAANSSCGAATPLTGTLTGQAHALGGPRPTGTGCASSAAPVVYYSVEIPAGSAAHVVATPTTAFDLTLRSLAECGSGNCLMARDAVPTGTGAAAAESITLYNTGTSPITQYVAVGADSATVFGTFDIALTSTVALAANATCGGAVDLTGTLTGETLPNGGPSLTDASCGSGNGSVRYYRVTIPANSTGTVLATPTGAPAWDLVVRQHADCAATTCLSAIDVGTFGAAETLRITNASASPITRLVSVGSIRAPGPTYDVSLATAPLPYIATTIAAMCADTSTGAVLATPVGGSSADDKASAVTALPFPITYFGGSITHFSASMNGFVELYSSATGTPVGFVSNAAIPATGTPNAILAPFWDDLYPRTGGEMRTLTTGAAGSQVFTIAWNGFAAGSATDPTMTFQVQIFEATGVIEFHYCTVGTGGRATGDSATIGIENATGTIGVQTSFNTAGAVMTGSGFRFTPNP